MHKKNKLVISTLAPGVSDEALWTPRQAAFYCGFQTPVTVLRAFRAGKLSGYKLGPHLVRFEPSQVRAWLAQSRVGRPLHQEVL